MSIISCPSIANARIPTIAGLEAWFGLKSSSEIYLQQQPVSLFTSQRYHRIHPHGPSARNKRRDEGHC